MTLRYLLDTTVFSEACKPRPSPRILQRLQDHGNESAVASVVWHEVRYGAARLAPSKRRSAIEKYLEQAQERGVLILDYDGRAAEWHAVERARLERIGKTPPFVDGQIAAIAAVNDLVVATVNTRDFSGFRGLKVERWG